MSFDQNCRFRSSQCTEVLFASFLSGGFTTMAVINPPERKLAKHTSVQWNENQWQMLRCKIALIKGIIWFALFGPIRSELDNKNNKTENLISKPEEWTRNQFGNEIVWTGHSTSPAMPSFFLQQGLSWFGVRWKRPLAITIDPKHFWDYLEINKLIISLSFYILNVPLCDI